MRIRSKGNLAFGPKGPAIGSAFNSRVLSHLSLSAGGLINALATMIHGKGMGMGRLLDNDEPHADEPDFGF